MKEEERIQDILHQLAAGKSREDIAKDYGLKDIASLNQFMRRRNYRWDKMRRSYVLAGTPSLPQRIQRVIMEFRSVTADAKDIAARIGFADHREMANFMRENGFVWSSDDRNYVPEDIHRTVPESLAFSSTDVPQSLVQPSINWADYIPLLQFLNDNRGRLYTLLDQTPPRTLTVPRYGVGGGHINKTVTVAAAIEELLKEFSYEKKISQREIFEVALIQFFYRYGYGKRMERHLIND